jgi:hypothetical protein
MSSLQAADDTAAFHAAAATSASGFRATTHTAVFGSCDQLRGGIFNARRTCRLFDAATLGGVPLTLFLAYCSFRAVLNEKCNRRDCWCTFVSLRCYSIGHNFVNRTGHFGICYHEKTRSDQTGWIRRYSVETLLTKVESIRVDQSVLGRMLDYGTIIISRTGGSKEPFHKIAQPMMFRRRVQDQISASEQLRNA